MDTAHISNGPYISSSTSPTFHPSTKLLSNLSTISNLPPQPQDNQQLPHTKQTTTPMILNIPTPTNPNLTSLSWTQYRKKTHRPTTPSTLTTKLSKRRALPLGSPAIHFCNIYPRDLCARQKQDFGYMERRDLNKRRRFKTKKILVNIPQLLISVSFLLALVVDFSNVEKIKAYICCL